MPMFEALVEGYLTTGRPETTHFPQHLLDNDDHGLLGWCLTGPGENISPFATLRDQYPTLWRACLAALAATQSENLSP